MANMELTKQFRDAIKFVAKQVVEEETRSCIRIYKAKVVTAPNNNVCEVRLVGDDTILRLPFSSKMATITVGKMVWVLAPYNSLSNGVVWETIDFK